MKYKAGYALRHGYIVMDRYPEVLNQIRAGYPHSRHTLMVVCDSRTRLGSVSPKSEPDISDIEEVEVCCSMWWPNFSTATLIFCHPNLRLLE